MCALYYLANESCLSHWHSKVLVMSDAPKMLDFSLFGIRASTSMVDDAHAELCHDDSCLHIVHLL